MIPNNIDANTTNADRSTKSTSSSATTNNNISALNLDYLYTLPLPMKLARMKILALILTYACNLFVMTKKREMKLLECIWGIYSKAEDPQLKHWAAFALCRLFVGFESHPRAVSGVYLNLLRLYPNDCKEIARASIDSLLPVLQSRLQSVAPGQEKFSFAKIWNYTKKILTEEANNLHNLIYLLQIIIRYPDVFYIYKHQLTSQMTSSIARIGFSPHSTLDHRIIALNIVDVLIGWEWFRRKRLCLRRQFATTASTTMNTPTSATSTLSLSNSSSNSKLAAGSEMEVVTNTNETADAPATENDTSSNNGAVDPNNSTNNNANNNAQNYNTSIMSFISSRDKDQERILHSAQIILIANFLVRLSLFAIESRDVSINRLLPICVDLFQKLVHVFPFEHVKLTYMDKFIRLGQTTTPTAASATSTANSNSNDVNPTSSPTATPTSATATISALIVREHAMNTYLEMTLSSFSSLHGSTHLLLQCLSQGGPLLIDAVFQLESPKIHALFRQFIKKLMTVYSPNDTIRHPKEFKEIDFYTKLKNVLQSRIKVPEVASSVLTVAGAQEMKNLQFCLALLIDVAEICPEWLNNHGSQLVKVCTELIADHATKAVKSSSKSTDAAFSVTHSADLGADWSTMPSHGLPLQSVFKEFASPFHSLNYNQHFVSLYTRSFISADHMTCIYLFMLIFYKGLQSRKAIDYLKKKVFPLMINLINGSDCPVVLNLLGQMGEAWILQPDSPLDFEEQYILYSKLCQNTDRDLRVKVSVVDGMTYGFALHFAVVANRMGNLYTTQPDVFKHKFASVINTMSSSSIANSSSLGAISVLCPCAEIRSPAMLRVFQFLSSTSLYERLLGFLTFDWNHISNRFFIALLPTVFTQLFLNSSSFTVADYNHISALTMAHGRLSEQLTQVCISTIWACCDTAQRNDLVMSVEIFLTKLRPKKILYHLPTGGSKDERFLARNIPQYLIHIMLSLDPKPQFSVDFLVAMSFTYALVPDILLLLDAALFESTTENNPLMTALSTQAPSSSSSSVPVVVKEMNSSPMKSKTTSTSFSATQQNKGKAARGGNAGAGAGVNDNKDERALISSKPNQTAKCNFLTLRLPDVTSSSSSSLVTDTTNTDEQQQQQQAEDEDEIITRKRVYNLYMHLLEEIHETDQLIALYRLRVTRPDSLLGLSYEAYDRHEEAQLVYVQSIKSALSSQTQIKTEENNNNNNNNANNTTIVTANDSTFELNMWENRWIKISKELSQWNSLGEFAHTQNLSHLYFESSLMNCNREILKRLRPTAAIVATCECGIITAKFADIMFAVMENKISEVERHCAQSVQLALNQWQIYPGLASSSSGHKLLLTTFQRIMELRESAAMSDAVTKSSREKKLPDVKSTLKNWKNRILNCVLGMSSFTSLLEWRLHIFNAIQKAYPGHDATQIASIHDSPWTTLYMAKMSRKRGYYELSFTYLERLRNTMSMDVTDAFTKLREQILWSLSPVCNDPLGAINLINSSNINFFNALQKSELFRLKGVSYKRFGHLFLSQAMESYANSIQLSPTHARAWLSWSHACYTKYYTFYDKSNPFELITDPSSNAYKEKIEAAKSTITCILKAVEYNSEPAHLLLHRVVWILVSIASENFTIQSLTQHIQIKENNANESKTNLSSSPNRTITTSSSYDPVDELVQIIVTYGSCLPAWRWLRVFHDMLFHFDQFRLPEAHQNALLPIMTSAALAYPNAVIFDLLALVSSSPHRLELRNAVTSSSSSSATTTATTTTTTATAATTAATSPSSVSNTNQDTNATTTSHDNDSSRSSTSSSSLSSSSSSFSYKILTEMTNKGDLLELILNTRHFCNTLQELTHLSEVEVKLVGYMTLCNEILNNESIRLDEVIAPLFVQYIVTHDLIRLILPVTTLKGGKEVVCCQAIKEDIRMPLFKLKNSLSHTSNTNSDIATSSLTYNELLEVSEIIVKSLCVYLNEVKLGKVFINTTGAEGSLSLVEDSDMTSDHISDTFHFFNNLKDLEIPGFYTHDDIHSTQADPALMMTHEKLVGFRLYKVWDIMFEQPSNMPFTSSLLKTPVVVYHMKLYGLNGRVFDVCYERSVKELATPPWSHNNSHPSAPFLLQVRFFIYIF